MNIVVIPTAVQDSQDSQHSQKDLLLCCDNKNNKKNQQTSSSLYEISSFGTICLVNL